MTDISELLSQLPIDQLAQQVGASPDEVREAAANAIPALVLGMDANAQDPAGAASLQEALGQHSGDLFGSLLGGLFNPESVDTGDGEKITANIFGSNEDAVISQLGGAGGSSLIRKLMPILAPLVMSWLAGKLMNVDKAQGQPQQSSGGGILGDILGQVLGGGAQQPQVQQQPQVVQQPQFKQQTGSGDMPTMQIPDPTPQYQEQTGGGLGGASSETCSAGSSAEDAARGPDNVLDSGSARHLRVRADPLLIHDDTPEVS
ncbi:DUF937 domain-containing protein [Tessaracoccus sp. HDW20]|uniref:DUF937 domain-containing protein n=1 Tax=Tessaracoccus coleopterorum TaxID=2714950 RepID=UPI0018D361A0|nr:DUF937 domain-containing protein [Tessaracoccus coleopterorum]NHB83646.1 DUF937 domain-containing protein [Tessaracoccus coleopterorum]